MLIVPLAWIIFASHHFELRTRITPRTAGEHRNQLPVVRQFPQNENILLESAVRFGHFQFYAGQFDGLN